jgi:hypothetical protein
MAETSLRIASNATGKDLATVCASGLGLRPAAGKLAITPMHRESGSNRSAGVDTMSRFVLDAFLDGCTGAGLFGKLRRPGAPTEIIDSRTVDEYLASGEFDETLSRFPHYLSQGKEEDPGA